MSDTLCQQFAQILGGTISNSTNTSCTVSRKRSNLNLTIMGRPAKTVLDAIFSFESMDNLGNTLNLGEIPILSEEAKPFITALQNSNIIVSGLHNHWLFDQPRIIYIHIESIDNPLSFARTVLSALKVLKQ